jgi:hypothetical protein
VGDVSVAGPESHQSEQSSCTVGGGGGRKEEVQSLALAVSIRTKVVLLKREVGTGGGIADGDVAVFSGGFAEDVGGAG